MNRRSPCGFTLVELLLALAIAAVLVTLLYSSYQTFSESSLRQQARLEKQAAVETALVEVSSDLERAFLTELEEVCKLVLVEGRNEEDSAAELSFCTYNPSPTETDLRWSDLYHVTYRLETGNEGVSRLLKTRFAVSGPGAYAPPQTNIVARQIDLFRVEVYDGAQWFRSWPDPESEATLRAARLVLRSSESEKELETDVYLPVGRRVASTLNRRSPDVPAVAAPAEETPE